MAENNGAAPAAGHATDQVTEAPDDGFTPEERQQWKDMQATEPAPVAEPPPADGAAPPIAEPPVPGAPADDDDEGDDEPAGAAPPVPGAAPDEKKPRRVSFSKYDRETKALQARIDAMSGTLVEKEAMQARLDERLKIINEALSTPPAADPAAPKKPALPAAEDDPEPDQEADIFAHSQWMRRELARVQVGVQETARGQQQERQTAQAVNDLNTEYLNDANDYASKQPHFAPAYRFLMDVRTAQLAQFHFGKDVIGDEETGIGPEKLTAAEHQQIARDIAAEERGIIQTAKRTGKGLAASVYKIARASGYRPATAGYPSSVRAAVATAPPDAGSAEPPHLAAANGRAPAPAAASVKDEIDRVKNGQDASLSLSNGGGAPAVTLDVKRLVDMSDEEFGLMVNSMSPAQLKALGG